MRRFRSVGRGLDGRAAGDRDPVGRPPRPPSRPTAPDQAAPARVRLALDWTPNTNHTGFYVAQAKGWYADAGIELEILPYGGTAPEAIVAADQAECGISFQDSMTFAAAAGVPIVSVMAILQHTAQDIAVLESSPIGRPRDLDGRTYAGFGYPNEVPTLQAVIRDDGGNGEFDSVTLDTAAYEALYNERADFVITFSAWEGVEAAQRGIPLRTFKFTDYGFPDFYQVVLACDADWLSANPEAARSFVGATVRGFELAATSPDEASAILVAQNPGIFDANPDLPGRLRPLHGRAGTAGGRERQGGRPDAGPVDRLLLVPVRAGAPRRRRGQAAGGPAGLRGPVHERLPALRFAAR